MWLSKTEPKGGGLQVVECHTCKHIVSMNSGTSVASNKFTQEYRWFCKDHRPGYTSFSVDYRGQETYFKEFRVNLAGEPQTGTYY